MDMTPQTWPEWYDGRHINEVLFCQQFLDKHPMKCVRGRLFKMCIRDRPYTVRAAWKKRNP